MLILMGPGRFCLVGFGRGYTRTVFCSGTLLGDYNPCCSGDHMVLEIDPWTHVSKAGTPSFSLNIHLAGYVH